MTSIFSVLTIRPEWSLACFGSTISTTPGAKLVTDKTTSEPGSLTRTWKSVTAYQSWAVWNTSKIKFRSTSISWEWSRKSTKRCSNTSRPWQLRNATLTPQSHLKEDFLTSPGKKIILKKRRTFKKEIPMTTRRVIRSRRIREATEGLLRKAATLLSSHWRESWKIWTTLF